jgi:hypothetical protein
MKQQQLEEIAQKIAVEIFAITAAYTKDTWKVEFEAVTNYQIPQAAVDVMAIESIYFAIHYLRQRSKGIFSPQEEQFFNKKVIETIIFALSNLYFESPDKEKNPGKHKKYIEELFSSYFEKRLAAYSIYKGNIGELFKEYIRLVFNDNDYKIKFVESTFRNRLRLKTAGILDALNGGKSKYAQDTFLDNKILDHYIKVVMNSLAEINMQKVVLEQDFNS